MLPEHLERPIFDADPATYRNRTRFDTDPTNPGLAFDRAQAMGKRLDIPAGTALRFEPGQTREVRLTPILGDRRVFGFRQAVMGDL